LPIVYSMIEAARGKPNNEIYEKYLYFWIAFNNIYTTLTFMDNVFPTSYRKDVTGNILRSNVNGIQMHQVRSAQESQEIDVAFSLFDDVLKHSLISHPNTHFFVNRKPKWLNQEISTDILRQKVNGVLKLNKMIDKDNPVWSPIDKAKFRDYHSGNNSYRDRANALNLLERKSVSNFHLQLS